jgi:hypothetical protein
MLKISNELDKLIYDSTLSTVGTLSVDSTIAKQEDFELLKSEFYNFKSEMHKQLSTFQSLCDYLEAELRKANDEIDIFRAVEKLREPINQLKLFDYLIEKFGPELDKYLSEKLSEWSVKDIDNFLEGKKNLEYDDVRYLENKLSICINLILKEK